MKFDLESVQWVGKDGYRTKRVFMIAENSFVQIVKIKPKAELKGIIMRYKPRSFTSWRESDAGSW